MKKVFVLIIILNSQIKSFVYSQDFEVHITYSRPEIISSSFGDAEADAENQKRREIFANREALNEEMNRNAVRFERKLALSSHVVDVINKNQAAASKFGRAKALFRKPYNEIKQLEAVSIRIAALIKSRVLNGLNALAPQEDRIMQAGIDDFHRAEDITELGSTRIKLVDEQRTLFAIQHTLTKDQKAELNTAEQKILLSESNLHKLHADATKLNMDKAQVSAKHQQHYQEIAQGVVSLAHITETAVGFFVPKAVGSPVNFTQTAVERSLQEYLINGKSPTDAISAGLQKSLDDFLLEKSAEEKGLGA